MSLTQNIQTEPRYKTPPVPAQKPQEAQTSQKSRLPAPKPLTDVHQKREHSIHHIQPTEADYKVGAEALKFLCEQVLGSLVFYFDEIERSCSGNELPELLEQLGIKDPLKKGAAALALYEGTRSKPLPKDPGHPIHISDPIQKFANNNVSKFINRCRAAQKSKNPAEALLKPNGNNNNHGHAHAVAPHKSYAINHFTSRKSSKAGSKHTVQEGHSYTQINDVVALLKSLIPGNVLKEAVPQLDVLTGRSWRKVNA